MHWSVVSTVTFSSEVSDFTAVRYSSRLRRSASRLSTTKPFSVSSPSASRASASSSSAVTLRELIRSSSSATSVDTTSCASVMVFIRNTSSRAVNGTRRLNIEDCIENLLRT
ncbi:MAG: hypothetical protein DMF93_24500 [Acidobacteria bacterium]|nr:MAG: hypothetical protein DMF93_24500 [Acidobacteriota bacterium]